jgi:hypothetical protein
VNTHPGLFAVKADKKAEEEKRQREEDERLYREVEIRELSARFDFSTFSAKAPFQTDIFCGLYCKSFIFVMKARS